MPNLKDEANFPNLSDYMDYILFLPENTANFVFGVVENI